MQNIKTFGHFVLIVQTYTQGGGSLELNLFGSPIDACAEYTLLAANDAASWLSCEPKLPCHIKDVPLK